MKNNLTGCLSSYEISLTFFYYLSLQFNTLPTGEGCLVAANREFLPILSAFVFHTPARIACLH